METRKQAILRAVVHEFTTSAVPVGSQSLQSRYFVDFLMDLEEVPERVLGFIDEELRHTTADVQGLVERVAMTTASVTGNASVASAPHGSQGRIKHVDLVSLEPKEVLLILLLEGNL